MTRYEYAGKVLMYICNYCNNCCRLYHIFIIFKLKKKNVLRSHIDNLKTDPPYLTVSTLVNLPPHVIHVLVISVKLPNLLIV